jgi:hypothetical protein
MLTSLFAILISSCNNVNPNEIPNEVIVIVELIKNKEKSQEELKEFTKRYSDYVKSTESNTLGWTYHDAGDMIILIERYKNEDANIVTAKNISPGGNRYKLLQESFNYHTLGKVTVIGGFTQKLIDFNKMTAEKVGFTAPFVYYPLISGYSKNLR